jgi:hypothetical protein
MTTNLETVVVLRKRFSRLRCQHHDNRWAVYYFGLLHDALLWTPAAEITATALLDLLQPALETPVHTINKERYMQLRRSLITAGLNTAPQ